MNRQSTFSKYFVKSPEPVASQGKGYSSGLLSYHNEVVLYDQGERRLLPSPVSLYAK